MKIKIMILGLLMIFASGCEMKEKSNIETEKVTVSSDADASVNETAATEMAFQETEAKISETNSNANQWPIPEENIKNINDEVDVRGYDGIDKSVTVLNVEFGKKYTGNKFEDYQKEILDSMEAQYDEMGNLLDDHIYMNLEIQVVNHQGDGEWNAADYPIVRLKDDRTVFNSANAPVWIHCDELVKDYNQKDCLSIPFASEESKNIHIIFALEEKEQDAGWGYFVSITSTWFPENDSYFIKL